ncbi:MAG: MFS transporter [Nevskiales bacterium]|nr:MFS transporter [Nevskiales bacterium]
MTTGDRRSRLPRTVWVLGGVSLCMDVSSEMIHALLPVFMVSVLGAGAVAVGLIEGIAEATAAITKVFSGWISDRVGRRKPLAVLGYGLAALTKPLFPLAGSAATVLLARFVDRIGKGIRGAPRDALVADVTPEPVRGAAYGLRQSLDTVGAFVGPLLALLLMGLFAGDFRAVFWVAVLPAFVAVALLVFGVREPASTAAAAPRGLALRPALALGADYRRVLFVGGLFTLARFSEAFLILRAHVLGLPDHLAPLVLVTLNVVYSLVAYPAGSLSDRVPRVRLLRWALLVLVIADVILAWAPGLPAMFAGVALWGLHLGLSQGLLAALIADVAPPQRRGAAFGVFHLVTGVLLLLASVVAGLLWDAVGPTATFALGAAFAMLALMLLRAPRGGVAAD